jgi:hypothetical protein
MAKLRDSHKRWMKDAAFRKEYDALEEELSMVAAIRQGAPPRRTQPGRTGAPDEDDAEHRRASRKRTWPALDAHTGAVHQSDGTSAQDQFSADEGEGVRV